MKNVLTLFALVSAVALTGCATAQAPEAQAPRLRLDEVVVMSQQGLDDEALIAEIETRGVAFVLSPQDFEQQRAAGVSEGLLRYLQGRARGEQDLRAKIVSGRYRLNAYSGALYLGYNYLGYYDGLHYYGGLPYYRGYGSYGGYAGGHRGGHGHHGGHGGHSGGRH